MEFLEDSYKVDSGKLIDVIRKETVARRTAVVSTILDPSDLEIKIENIVDDLVVNMGLDPVEARKSVQNLVRVTKTVPEIDTEFQYSWDTLQRINKSKLPVSQRVALGSREFTKYEDAMFLAETLTGTVGDIQAICVSGNNTVATAELDLTSYTTMKATLAGMIGQLISGLGNIKPYPLYMFMTPDVYNRLLGIGNDTSDRSGVEYMNAVLKQSGSAASEVVISENLGCTLTKTKSGLAITENTLTAALMASDGQFQTISAGTDVVWIKGGSYITYKNSEIRGIIGIEQTTGHYHTDYSTRTIFKLGDYSAIFSPRLESITIENNHIYETGIFGFHVLQASHPGLLITKNNISRFGASGIQYDPARTDYAPIFTENNI